MSLYNDCPCGVDAFSAINIVLSAFPVAEYYERVNYSTIYNPSNDPCYYGPICISGLSALSYTCPPCNQYTLWGCISGAREIGGSSNGSITIDNNLLSAILLNQETSISIISALQIVTLDLANPTDAFGRLRVSNPETIFDSKQIYDNQPLFWDDQQVSGTSTTSTYNTNRASTILTVDNTTTGKRVRQTFQSFNYQPAKSQLIFMTGVLGTPTLGVTREIGIGDDNNGLFLRTVDDEVYFTIRSYSSGSPVNTDVAQTNWSDPFDGTGPSGITIDWTKTQILSIDFEWLGVGTVRFSFVIDGKMYLAYIAKHANNLDVVYMSKPNLPLRYSIESTATGASEELVSLEHICSSIISEGGSEELGLIRSISTGGVPVDAAAVGTTYAILGLRLKSSYIGSVIKVLKADIQIQTSNDSGEWSLLLKPTVAGTFTYNDITNSPLQVAKGATANTISGGTIISIGFAESSSGDTGKGGTSSEIKTSRYIGATIDGASETVVLCWTPKVGSNQSIEGALTWREL